MNQLNPAKRAQVIRATVRITGASKNAIQRLMPLSGQPVRRTLNRALRNLPCKKIQCDEIWSLLPCEAKERSADKEGQFGFGDVWTWTAPCADTKLICSWKIGTRGASAAYALKRPDEGECCLGT